MSHDLYESLMIDKLYDHGVLRDKLYDFKSLESSHYKILVLGSSPRQNPPEICDFLPLKIKRLRDNQAESSV